MIAAILTHRAKMDKAARYQKYLYHKKMASFHNLAELLINGYDRVKNRMKMREALELIHKWFDIQFPDANGRGCYIRRTIRLEGGGRISLWVNGKIEKNGIVARQEAERYPNKVKTPKKLPTVVKDDSSNDGDNEMEIDVTDSSEEIELQIADLTMAEVDNEPTEKMEE